MAKVRNQEIDIVTMEYRQPLEPKSFDKLGYMNYSKTEIIQMYLVIHRQLEQYKAIAQESEVRAKILEDKLMENGIDPTFSPEDTDDYLNSTKALVKTATKTFEEEFIKEMASYDEMINHQIAQQLEKVKDSYKNSTEYSLMKTNTQIEMLEKLLERTYKSRTLNIRDKNKQVLQLSAELRQQYAAKEKILGRDISKTAKINVNANVSNNNTPTEVNWNDIKDGVIEAVGV